MKLVQKVLIEYKDEQYIGKITYFCKNYFGGFLIDIEVEGKNVIVHRFENEIVEELTESEAKLLEEKIKNVKSFCKKEDILYKDISLGK